MDQPLTPDPVRAAVVVLAGGSGTRLGAGVNKVYLPLAGRPVISWSVRHATAVPAVRRVVLVARAEDLDLVRQLCSRECPDVPVDLTVGGETRHDSEQAALDLLAPAIDAGELDVVAIHDGARPLAGPALFDTVIHTAARYGAAVPGVTVHGVIPTRASQIQAGEDDLSTAARGGLTPDRGQAAERDKAMTRHGGATVPEDTALWRHTVNGGATVQGEDTARKRRSILVAVQTPQAFRAGDLLDSYRQARREGFRGTDTAATLERYSALEVRHVPSSRHNLKITFRHDLDVAERLLMSPTR